MPSPSESHDAVRNLKQRATDLLEQVAALPLLATDIEFKRANPAAVKDLRDVSDILSAARWRVHELHNMLLPVNRLPPEVMVEIFKFYVLEWATYTATRQCSPIPLDSHVASVQQRSCYITHVCHRWRDIALGVASFWNHILAGSFDDIFKEGGLRMESEDRSFSYLERSRQAPLHLEITCCSVSEQLWEKLLQMDRLRTLKLSYVSTDILDALSNIHTAAPTLQTLQIRLQQYFTRTTAPYTTAIADLPRELPTLFGGSTPQLKHLIVDHFVAFADNRFENLTYLQLQHQLYQTSGEVVQLLVFLDGILCLQQLSFVHCTVEPGAAQTFLDSDVLLPSGEECAVLEHLRLFELQYCDANFITCLLARLQLPSDDIVVFTSHCPPPALLNGLAIDPLEEDEDSASGPLSSITSLHLAYGKSEHELDSDTPVRIRATGPTTAVLMEFPALASDFPFRHTATEITPNLWQSFPLHALTHLKLTGNDMQPVIAWRNIFRAMKSLTSLVVYLYSDGPVKWLVSLTETGETSPYPAPKLSTLCICYPVLSAWDALVALAKTRMMKRHPLKAIRITAPRKGGDTIEYQETIHELEGKRGEIEMYGPQVVFASKRGYGVSEVPEVNRPYMSQQQLKTWL